MRALLTALCRLLLRIFFRRIDAVHVERVPTDFAAPVLYVLNHPNALLDPLFILCMSPRPVTFLAKAPLFSTFLVKHFVRAFECLPVYRAQDGDDPSKNRASIEASIALLASGKALALFPEGVSHSKPQMVPLKTGAARIALSASASADGRTPRAVLIVPVGLWYADKTTFRSRAALVYGQPLTTPVVQLDARGRPPEDVAAQLTETIAESLAEVTIQAQTHEAIELARAVARILAAAERDGEQPPSERPAVDIGLEQRLVSGYERLRERDPARVEAVVARVRRFEHELARLGLAVDHPARLDARAARRWTLMRVAVLSLLAVPGSIGVVTHFLPYRAIDVLAHGVARRHAVHDDGADVLATLKLLAGLLLFPLTWLVLALIAGLVVGRSGVVVGTAVLVGLPLCAWAGLWLVELGVDFYERARGAVRLWTRRELSDFVSSERAAIRAEVVALAQQLDDTRADTRALGAGS